MASFSIIKTGQELAEQQAIPVVRKAVSYVDGDKFEKLARTMDENAPYAEQLRLSLLNLKESVGCQYLYTMVASGGTNFTYVVDGSCDPSDEENYSPMGTVEDISSWGPAPFATMKNGKISCSGLKHQDGWGWNISTYQAVKNSSGTIVGLVGCDFDVEFIISSIKVQITKISILSITFVLMGAALLYIFSSLIFGTMKDISKAMEKISQGTADLTERIPVKKLNELGFLASNCNSVIKSLGDLVARLQDETGVLTETSQQLSSRMESHIDTINSANSRIDEINSRVGTQTEKIGIVVAEVTNVESQIGNPDNKINDQRAAIEQASSAIEEISANIQSVNKTVKHITNEYVTLVEQSREGSHIQEEVSKQIEDIANQSQNLTEANAAISAIAEQTNLLAMNAAIEAAHAGDLGKGFGVVADEIRTLAETSATQSNAIRELLDGISNEISEIVSSSKQSSMAFENVGSKIDQMHGMMREITHGMEEETIGVENILDTMKTLDGTTRSISEASGTMKSASSKVNREVHELESLAEETRRSSDRAAQNMEEMNGTPQEVSYASKRNAEATEFAVGMLTGFKVKLKRLHEFGI